MSKRININSKFDIIHLYSATSGKWEDKSDEITAIYESYYREQFTGYNIYFINSKNHYFYKKSNVRFTKRPIIQKTKEMYSSKNEDRIHINKNVHDVISSSSNNVLKYFMELSIYAAEISDNDEPILSWKKL